MAFLSKYFDMMRNRVYQQEFDKRWEKRPPTDFGGKGGDDLREKPDTFENKYRKKQTLTGGEQKLGAGPQKKSVMGTAAEATQKFGQRRKPGLLTAAKTALGG